MPCCLSLVLHLLCFRFRRFAFAEAVALRSSVLYASVCMRPDSHTQLPNNYLRTFSFLFLTFFLSWRCRFFRVFLYHYRFLCMESTSYGFPLRIAFFYLVTTGWVFFTSAYVRETHAYTVHLYSSPCGGTIIKTRNTMSLDVQYILTNS